MEPSWYFEVIVGDPIFTYNKKHFCKVFSSKPKWGMLAIKNDGMFAKGRLDNVIKFWR